MENSFNTILEKINFNTISDNDLDMLETYVKKEKETRENKIEHLKNELYKMYALKGKRLVSFNIEPLSETDKKPIENTDTHVTRTVPKEIVMLNGKGKPIQFFKSTKDGLEFLRKSSLPITATDTSHINWSIRHHVPAYGFLWARSVATRKEITDNTYAYYVKSTGELIGYNNL